MAVKGGLGVSTLALNVGICLQDRSKKEVIIAEFRPGEGTMALDLATSILKECHISLNNHPKILLNH
jgi:Flp pilus assembly CpaE family ATPase